MSISYNSLIAALPVAPVVREELQALCDIMANCPQFTEDNPGMSARDYVAAALIDIDNLGADCGGHYDCPRGCLPADMRAARLEWRAIHKAARRLLATDFYPESCDYNSKMREIDAQNLAR